MAVHIISGYGGYSYGSDLLSESSEFKLALG